MGEATEAAAAAAAAGGTVMGATSGPAKTATIVPPNAPSKRNDPSNKAVGDRDSSSNVRSLSRPP